MRCKVDVGGVVFEDDIVDVKTDSLRQPHASIGDESDKPPGLIVLHSTVLLYASDVIQRYGFASLIVIKVRQIDTRKGVPAVEAMLLDAQVDDGADGREVTLYRVRSQPLGQEIIPQGRSVRRRVGIDWSVAKNVDDGLDVPLGSPLEHLPLTNSFQPQVKLQRIMECL